LLNIRVEEKWLTPSDINHFMQTICNNCTLICAEHWTDDSCIIFTQTRNLSWLVCRLCHKFWYREWTLGQMEKKLAVLTAERFKSKTTVTQIRGGIVV